MLNARRHRSGGDFGHRSRLESSFRRAQRPKASERRRQSQDGATRSLIRRAQRPKGIGAAATTSMLGMRRAMHESSTPEGIGAAATLRSQWCTPTVARCNARRHRSGGDLREHWKIRTRRCAQRPKASERRRHPEEREFDEADLRAQRPKASERRRLSGSEARRDRNSMCSTPEGIGAATT